MSFTTPIHPSESSAKRLLKQVLTCIELGFERAPIRYITSKRKSVRLLSPTLSTSITLFSIDDGALVDNHIISDL